jgi:hypothetical protein
MSTTVSCARVKVTDTEWCGDMGESGAHCVRTLSKKERSVSKEVWDEARVGQVCTTSEAFAEWKANQLKLCSGLGRCDYEEVEGPTE